MNALIMALLDCGFSPEHIHPDEPMSAHTTFRVGGPADIYADVTRESDLKAACKAASQVGVPVTVVGNGSNLLVKDKGIRGMVIHIGSGFSETFLKGDSLVVRAGASIASCARAAQQAGLCGMAELSGIPGTIAGGVLMNAGSYGQELGNLVTQVDSVQLSDGSDKIYRGDQLSFGYRRSFLMTEKVVITGVHLKLSQGDPDMIAAHMESLAAQRRAKQPLEFPSAGSTFKRPEGHFAAQLIDECGLKGLTVGGAQVSPKHAGFIVNLGSATAEDILNLMAEVEERVYATYGIRLEPEIRILGE